MKEKDFLPEAVYKKNIIDMEFGEDGTRYVEDVLSIFGLPCVLLKDSPQIDIPHLTIRHDVDNSIENALSMAFLEEKYKIQSTYFLLHPDGDIRKSNYFGYIEDRKLYFNPDLFNYAHWLVDHGHEIGFHNDLITLAIATKRKPEEFLDQIVHEFRKNKIDLNFSREHGSKSCYTYNYRNDELFTNRDTFNFPNKDKNSLVADDFEIPLFKISLADYGLIQVIIGDSYLTDSGNHWGISTPGGLFRGEDSQPKDTWINYFKDAVKPSRETKLHCNIHPCHWNTIVNNRQSVVSTASLRLANRLLYVRSKSVLRNLMLLHQGEERSLLDNQERKNKQNVIYIKELEGCTAYNNTYLDAVQHFVLTDSTKNFVSRYFTRCAFQADISLLEVGCGQGDFLNHICSTIKHLNPSIDVYGLGVDASLAGILTSAMRYDHLYWASSELNNFLSIHDENVRIDGQPRRYQYIIDKTGATSLESSEVHEFFEKLTPLLSPSGSYIYIASKSFYEKHYGTRAETWLDIAQKYFSEMHIFDDSPNKNTGYFIRIFSAAKQKYLDPMHLECDNRSCLK